MENMDLGSEAQVQQVSLQEFIGYKSALDTAAWILPVAR